MHAGREPAAEPVADGSHRPKVGLVHAPGEVDGALGDRLGVAPDVLDLGRERMRRALDQRISDRVEAVPTERHAVGPMLVGSSHGDDLGIAEEFRESGAELERLALLSGVFDALLDVAQGREHRAQASALERVGELGQVVMEALMGGEIARDPADGVADLVESLAMETSGSVDHPSERVGRSLEPLSEPGFEVTPPGLGLGGLPGGGAKEMVFRRREAGRELGREHRAGIADLPEGLELIGGEAEVGPLDRVSQRLELLAERARMAHLEAIEFAQRLADFLERDLLSERLARAPAVKLPDDLLGELVGALARELGLRGSSGLEEADDLGQVLAQDPALELGELAVEPGNLAASVGELGVGVRARQALEAIARSTEAPVGLGEMLLKPARALGLGAAEDHAQGPLEAPAGVAQLVDRRRAVRAGEALEPLGGLAHGARGDDEIRFLGALESAFAGRELERPVALLGPAKGGAGTVEILETLLRGRLEVAPRGLLHASGVALDVDLDQTRLDLGGDRAGVGPEIASPARRGPPGVEMAEFVLERSQTREIAVLEVLIRRDDALLDAAHLFEALDAGGGERLGVDAELTLGLLMATAQLAELAQLIARRLEGQVLGVLAQVSGRPVEVGLEIAREGAVLLVGALEPAFGPSRPGELGEALRALEVLAGLGEA